MGSKFHRVQFGYGPMVQDTACESIYRPKEFMINNLEIHPRYHIENFAFKSVFSKSGIFGQFGKPNETAPSSVILSPEEVG